MDIVEMQNYLNLLKSDLDEQTYTDARQAGDFYAHVGSLMLQTWLDTHNTVAPDLKSGTIPDLSRIYEIYPEYIVKPN
jgi:hypothetical protein